MIQDEELCLKLHERCYKTFVCEDLQKEQAAIWKAKHRKLPANAEPDLARAYCLMVASWQSKNGFCGTTKNFLSSAKRYVSSGGDSGVRWRSVVESITAWHQRLFGVQVWSMDAFEMLEKIGDEPGVLIYCDPPYVEKGAQYLYDFTSNDRERLAASLSRFRHVQVVLSYTEYPKVRELYTSWLIVEIKTNNSLVYQHGRERMKSAKPPELVITNRSKEKSLFTAI